MLLARSRSLAAAALCVVSVAATSAVPTPAAAAARTSLPGTGTYDVGEDIRPGLYRSSGNRACAVTLARADHSVSGTIRGQELVRIRKTDVYLETRNCRAWKRVSAEEQQRKGSRRTRIPTEGVFLVGVDFRPGLYRAAARGGPGPGALCYWQRSRSVDLPGSTIEEGSTLDTTTVRIRRSDKVFYSTGCTAWQRVR